ncbi:unnamed protein product [Vitrella brassicaformis CCMP3155]|uniref:Uncharacterized protein n=2 Tax=Vitrella brassicaformis TaxID=1169539 RepID=A0A0G4E9E1_VITBC|nr:unnamed protein product [Vitrella brassicaformis CCMP3155]|mmetsp:Transcript_45869/g.114060  ORF Transcript_45869/g.114060 Transcript_45869/m.114060 type:complete len:172 (+) Transcript_45869:175-690(+)|eukprot:CEL91858.1 unnamed protein product [Vitrella brassicaformis CCMP3155]
MGNSYSPTHTRVCEPQSHLKLYELHGLFPDDPKHDVEMLMQPPVVEEHGPPIDLRDLQMKVLMSLKMCWVRVDDLGVDDLEIQLPGGMEEYRDRGQFHDDPIVVRLRKPSQRLSDREYRNWIVEDVEDAEDEAEDEPPETALGSQQGATDEIPQAASASGAVTHRRTGRRD